MTKSCFPIFVVENVGQVWTDIKVGGSIWIVARSPSTYYSFLIIYATVHTIDVDIYVCFHFFPSPYVALSLDSG